MAQRKPVEELIQSGVVPEEYIIPKVVHEVTDAPYMDGMSIDLSLLLSSTEELEKLHSAMSSWGCFQIVNHGITNSLLHELREMTKQFFTLPLEEKKKYLNDIGGAAAEGYGNSNPDYLKNHLQWNDRLILNVHPEEKRNLKYWPEKPDNFRKTLHEYTTKIRMILETLFKAMARSLKLEENRFSELWQVEEDTIIARFNFYPHIPNSYANLIFGLRPHDDGSAITFVLQDEEVEGLQVLKDNKWFKVPIIPGALVVVVAEQLEIVSNGIFKSCTHKAIVNPNFDRISLAMLSLPNREKEIGPLPELITEERPQLYKRIKDYTKVYFQGVTTTPIDLVKIK